MIDIRDNWRVILLVVLCILAALALFGPLGAGSGTPDFVDDDGQTELLTTTTTDEDGEYEMELPVGEYDISIDDWDYESYETNTTVDGNETTVVDITLTDRASGTISGDVTSGGAAVTNVTVEVLDRDTGEVVRTATPGDGGTYSEAIPTGDYQVQVDEIDYEPFTSNVTVSEGATSTVDITLDPRETGSVAGTVTADGEVRSGIEMEVIEPGEGIVATATSDENGEFDVGLPVGEYDLRVDDVAHEFFEETVTVAADETTTTDVSLIPVDTGTITGTVATETDPVGGIEIVFSEFGSQEAVLSVESDEGGTYEAVLPTGEYDLTIDDLLYDEVATTVAIEHSETTERDLTLTRVETGTLTGTVTDEAGNPIPGIELGIAESIAIDQTLEGDRFRDPTNLQYGLELSGGARIRGQLVGLTAENVGLDGVEGADVQRVVSEELGLDPIDVRVRSQLDAVEIFDESISRAEFANALQSANLDVSEDDVRRGVTEITRDGAVDTLTERVDQTGLSGADVFTTSGVTGEHFIVAEVPGITLGELRQIIEEPGRVQIIAGYPDEDGQLVTTEVLTTEDFAGIQPAQPPEAGRQAHVPVTLGPDAAERYANLMRDAGFTSPAGIGNCFFDVEQHDGPREGEHCLYTVVDGEFVYGASMSEDLAGTINAEEFVASPSFQMQTGTFEEAQQLEVNLRAGELPTEINVASQSFISPSLAQLFKPLALLTAIIAWLAVCAVVYYWYRDVRVAAPMLLTASSEVFLLLGFAAFVGLAMDLSHIAGLIAVIGTGLDDLIIMADEILQRKKDVKTGRVFQSRFRKAFWIIGMAAATTIIAMSPLAVLSLGDLQGFAIVTIVGVLIGVGVTRPAYGDILRHLMLEDVKRTGK